VRVVFVFCRKTIRRVAPKETPALDRSRSLAKEGTQELPDSLGEKINGKRTLQIGQQIGQIEQSEKKLRKCFGVSEFLCIFAGRLNNVVKF